MGKVVTTGVSILSTQVTISTYKLGRVQKTTIYTDDTRTVKVSEIVYSYAGSKVTQAVTTTYAPDGITPVRVDTSNYFNDKAADGSDMVIEKKA